MISIIICSRNPVDAKKSTINVSETIGVPYEVIIVDNSANQYGICEAYNVGASRSKYKLLCFMHEDIILHTFNWGERIMQIFADSSIGLLGVAGSTYVMKSPSAWWDSGKKNRFMHIMHTTQDRKQEVQHYNESNQILVDVAVIDGVWMCTRKEIWEKKPFDATVLDEFHFYDMDFSLSVREAGKRVCVTFEVVIEHFSMGSINASWTKNALKFNSKRRDILPYGVDNYSEKERQANELINTKVFVNRLLSHGYGLAVVSKYIWEGFKIKPWDRDLLYLLKKKLL